MEEQASYGKPGNIIIGTFNPSGNPAIDKIKQLSAEIINVISQIDSDSEISESIRERAIMNVLEAQMMAVKYVVCRNM